MGLSFEYKEIVEVINGWWNYTKNNGHLFVPVPDQSDNSLIPEHFHISPFVNSLAASSRGTVLCFQAKTSCLKISMNYLSSQNRHISALTSKVTLSPRPSREARCEGRRPERARVLILTCVESCYTRGY